MDFQNSHGLGGSLLKKLPANIRRPRHLIRRPNFTDFVRDGDDFMNTQNFPATLHEAAAPGERDGLAAVTWEQMPPEDSMLRFG